MNRVKKGGVVDYKVVASVDNIIISSGAPSNELEVISSLEIGDIEKQSYLQYLTEITPVNYMRLIKRVGIGDIEKSMGGSWSSLSHPERISILFNMGFDLISKNPAGKLKIKGYWIQKAIYRDSNNNPTEGYVIVASERTDKKWLRGGYASEEAVLYSKDRTMRGELPR